MKFFKKRGFDAVSQDFDEKWSSVLHAAEIGLVRLLWEELTNVIEKLHSGFDDALEAAHQDGSETRFKDDFKRYHMDFKNELKYRRILK